MIKKIHKIQKMVKKSENLKKSEKNHKKSLHFYFFIFYLFFGKKKKCNSLSFPISGGRDSTRALQSILFQKYENLKISQKFTQQE